MSASIQMKKRKKGVKRRTARKKFVRNKSACFGCRKPSKKGKQSKVRKLIKLSKSRKRK